jgi:hypothetical protein
LARIKGKSAKAFGKISPEFNCIGGENCGPEALGQHCKDEANRALAQDRYPITALQREQFDCFEAGIYGFNPAGLIERHTIRNHLDAAIYNPVHYANVLRESPASRLIASRYTHPFVLRTLSIQAAIAVEAVATRYVVENDHAIARGIFRNPIADGCNDAGSFVAVDPRRREEVVLDFLQIGMTNAAALHSNQNFALRQRWRLDRFEGDAAGA